MSVCSQRHPQMYSYRAVGRRLVVIGVINIAILDLIIVFAGTSMRLSGVGEEFKLPH